MVTRIGIDRFLLVCALACFVGGCGPADDPATSTAPADTHDHEGATDEAEGPQDLPAGVAAMQGCYEKIRDAFQTGSPDDAHQPLHEVGHLLQSLTTLAGQSDLAAADRQKVTDAVGRMFDAYGKIDRAIHEGKEPDYAAVSDDLDQAMTDITAVVAEPDVPGDS